VALDLRELSAAGEWYVGVNGVPVGPIRVAELRRKAAAGVVTEESLCWQEGMEEWRPVRAVSELAAVVREAAAGGRVSLVTPPPPESRPSVAPPRTTAARPAPAPAAPRRPLGTSGAPISPLAPPGPSARSNVVPIHSRLATAERRSEAFDDLDVVAVPSAEPLVQPPPSPIQVTPLAATADGAPPLGAAAIELPAPAVSTSAAAPAPVPLASPAPAPAPVPLASPASIAAMDIAPFRKPPPFTAIAMIVLAAAFGITAAIVLVKPAPQVVVQVPSAAPVSQAPAVPAVTASPNDNAAVASPPTPDGGPSRPASGVATHASASAAAAKPAASTSTATAGTDPALRDLIQGAAGPSAGPSDTSGSGGGAQLTEDQVTHVLAQHTTAVKRTCWERIQTSSSSVNVTVHIVVGSTGQVSSATATGNDPVVGHCIEGEVRRWSFPGSGAIDIPFHFLRQ